MNEKFNLTIDTIRAFLPKNRTLFSIFQKGRVEGGGVSSLPPSFTRIGVAEYASISLNILKYP